jgi:hypothetical protein
LCDPWFRQLKSRSDLSKRSAALSGMCSGGCGQFVPPANAAGRLRRPNATRAPSPCAPLTAQPRTRRIRISRMRLTLRYIR